MYYRSLLSSLLLTSLLYCSAPKKASTSQGKPHTFHPANSWKDPKTVLSCPPPLTGKQMGTIETLGIQPLGYKKEGNVKVFHLIAQPIDQWMTDGVAKHNVIVPTLRKLYGLHHDMKMSVQQKFMRGATTAHLQGQP